MKAETRFIRQIQRWQVMWNFKANTSEMAKRFQADKKTYVFRCYHVHNREYKKSAWTGGTAFSKYLTADEISSAALCKARQKIKYTAFEELFEQTAASAPKDKRFHGYHLYAVDGMKGELPKLRNYPQNTAKLKSVKRRYFTQYQLLIFWMRCSYVLNFILELPMKENSPARWLMLWHKMYITRWAANMDIWQRISVFKLDSEAAWTPVVFCDAGFFQLSEGSQCVPQKQVCRPRDSYWIFWAQSNSESCAFGWNQSIWFAVCSREAAQWRGWNSGHKSWSEGFP